MSIIDKRINEEIISDKAKEAFIHNQKKIEELKPTIKIIKTEQSKIKDTCESFDDKLSPLHEELNLIEESNKELQDEILFLTRIFESLRNIIVNLEIQNESFDIFMTENFESPDEIAKIEKAISSFNEFDSAYKIRVIEERKNEINKTLKLFFKRFVAFFNRKINKIESTSKGELKIHTFLYHEVKIYESLFNYCATNFYDIFIQLITLYKEANRKIYKKEFETHLRIINKIFSEGKSNKVKEVFDIFFESFFLIIKAELHFCDNHILFKKVDLIEFVNDIFYDIIDYLVYSLNGLFEKMPLELINALEMNYSFDFLGNEKIIWTAFVERIKNEKKSYEKRFLIEEKDNFLSRKREKNLEITLSNLKICKKEETKEKLIKMQIDDILREEEDIEDRIKVLKMLLRLENEIEKKEIINELIGKKFKELEKEIIFYAFSNEEKEFRRIERLNRFSKEEKKINEFVEMICCENANEENREEIKKIFNKKK